MMPESSWPGLPRPSTPYLRRHNKFDRVDARNKSGHDIWYWLLGIFFLLFSLPLEATETKPFTKESFAAIKAEHQGKPLAVHFWSVHCAPCLAEFPRLKAISELYPQLRLIMVATDPPETPSITRLLSKHGLEKKESWAFADPFAERVRFAIDRSWKGELPRTYLIAPNGQTTTLAGAIEEKQIEEWLKRQF
jgi:thiol-disulfide isomerase/thioredoxin